MGKEVLILNQDPTPVVLSFLPGSEEIIHQAPLNERFDVAFALDCGDKTRLGAEFGKVKQIGKIINIDHHVTNKYFGDLNYVDPLASSTTEILYDLIRILPGGMDLAVAENIYTGILTDTGSFQYSNTTAKTFSVARFCLLTGVNPWKIAENIFENQPLPRLRLLPLVLETFEVTEDGRISSLVVTQQMLKEAGATPAHTEDFINFARSLKGAEVALLFREISPEQYRVSMRSRGKVNVARIAEEFLGGGHHNAAGCSVAGNLSEVKAKVLERVQSVL